MGKLLDRIKTIFHERRKDSVKVAVDRRHRPCTLKDADEAMYDAVEKLEQTARMRRDDFYDRIK